MNIPEKIISDYGLGTFDSFIATCEYLAKDLEENPYGADSDHIRVKALISIAKACNQSEK